ncbi:MAG TPA: DUF6526 family protein [Thermoanaerobaculia bacterium]|nr:DUF6526 family protein [Thermoanaerobaculia bacterium]HQR68517.1 DUF6526 family protein [Thermoanaerobaculia bacterium]
MADPSPQTYANHRRYDPLFHVFVFGILALSLLVSLWQLVRNPGFTTAWVFLVFAALLVLYFKVRLYALKVQDRVIRLEERLRLGQLLSGPLRSRIDELTEGQLIGLRFASDGEVAALVAEALDEKLPGEEIKKRVKSWRPDTFRV